MAYLGSVAETLHTASNLLQQPPTGSTKAFSDALRWQLGRILGDQTGSQAPYGDHAASNTSRRPSSHAVTPSRAVPVTAEYVQSHERAESH